MFSIWFYGAIVFVLASTFYAGINSKSLFFRAPKYGEVGHQIDEDKAAGYLLITTAVSISWPLSLPIICLYKIGQLFSKEK